MENKELMRAMLELRRGSRTSRHVPRPRKGARGDRRRAAVREGREQ